MYQRLKFHDVSISHLILHKVEIWQTLRRITSMTQVNKYLLFSDGFGLWVPPKTKNFRFSLFFNFSFFAKNGGRKTKNQISSFFAYFLPNFCHFWKFHYVLSIFQFTILQKWRKALSRNVYQPKLEKKLLRQMQFWWFL